MHPNLTAFIAGAREGARETPRGFFAPVTALFRWLNRVTDEAMAQAHPSSYRGAAELVGRAEGSMRRVSLDVFERLHTLDPVLHATALDVFDDELVAASWLASRNDAFEGQTAYEYLAAGKRGIVMALLEAITPGEGSHD